MKIVREGLTREQLDKRANAIHTACDEFYDNSNQVGVKVAAKQRTNAVQAILDECKQVAASNHAHMSATQ